MHHLLLCSTVLIAAGLASLAQAGPDGDWFILGGDGFWTSDVKHPAAQRLLEQARKGQPLQCVAFTPSDEWIVLCGGNGVFAGADLPVGKKLAELGKDPAVKEFRCVAFTARGGWAALADGNRYLSDGIPDDAAKKLKELADGGAELRSIAFTPSGGWVILGGDSGAWYRGIPDDAARKLGEMVEKKVRVLCTAFDSRGHWVFLTDGNGVWTNAPDLDAVKTLTRLRGEGVPLKWVAFRPEVQTGEWMIVREPTCRVKAVLTTDATDSSGRAHDWVIFAPEAPTLPGQADGKTTLVPAGRIVEEFSPLKRRLILGRVPTAPRQLRAVLTVEATLYARRLVPRAEGAPAVPDLAPAEVKKYTRASEHANFGAKGFQEWLERNDLRKKDGESDIAFARRAFGHMQAHFRYDKKGDPHAAFVCKEGKSDCGGLSCVMVALLRANGIPARLLQGRWAESQGPPEAPGGPPDLRYHTKAEFFARGVGWVPLDTSAAITDRGRGEFAHFGNDPGNFVTLFVDQDGEVDSVLAGRVRTFGLQGLWLFRQSAPGATLRVEEKWEVTRGPAKGR